MHNKGIAAQAHYPYKGVGGTCNKNEANTYRAAKITGYEDVPANELALLKAVAIQPVSVAIDAGGAAFQFYSGGIFTGGCGTDLNHDVAVVGYGTGADGTKYWLVKNSWGRGWGEGGYVRMQRDVRSRQGLCGIAIKASYPTA